MTVATLVQPDRTNPAQTGTIYPANIDAAIAVLAELAGAFAAHAQATPNMTVVVDAGKLQVGTGVTVAAAQSTGTIVAPTTNPRIDRVVIDSITGVVSVITGVEAASPAAPAITAGKLAVARVLLAISTTVIANSIITSERAVVPTFAHTLAETHSGSEVFSGAPSIDLTGGQIKFPATQNPSADANTLDDYEEGTFTPGLQFGGAAVGLTFSAQAGAYTKKGREVTFLIELSVNVKGSSVGQARITGLPFTSSTQKSACTIGNLNVITFTGQMFSSLPDASTSPLLQQSTEAGVRSNLADTNFANASYIIVSGTYFI